MRSDPNHRLAIRTVLVTTRAAVKSNLAAGEPEMARRSAVRGAALLQGLADWSMGDERLSLEYADAKREMHALAQLEEQPPAFAFAVGDSPLPSRTHRR